MIFTMDPQHKRRLACDFRDSIGERPVCALTLPDGYPVRDCEQVALLRVGGCDFLGIERG